MQRDLVGSIDTSTEAYIASRPRAPNVRAEIVRAIKASVSGMTCDELEVTLKERHTTVSARICELHSDPKHLAIYDTGQRRPTRSGCMARVYMDIARRPITQVAA